MAEIDEKKDKFYLAINHYAEQQRERIEREIAAYQRKELKRAEIEVLNECYRMIQKEMNQMRGGIAREMATRETEDRRRLLKRRAEITDEVFRKAAGRLREFSRQDGYAGYLERSARKFAELFGRPGVVIDRRPEDQKHEETIRRALGLECTFRTDASIRLGGLRASHPEFGILADETFDSLLADQRGWFEKNSGLAFA